MYSCKIRTILFEITRLSLAGGGASPKFSRPLYSHRVAEDAKITRDARSGCKVIVLSKKNAAEPNVVLINETMFGAPIGYGVEAPVQYGVRG
jgi:hypothetical protein